MQSEAFDLEYLGRVMDVKDTVHKAPLMLHLVELVVDKFPESSDLYSEMPNVHRISKVRTLQYCLHVLYILSRVQFYDMGYNYGQGLNLFGKIKGLMA